MTVTETNADTYCMGLVLAGMLLALPAIAQEPETNAVARPATELSPVVVTGTRLERDPVEQPYALYRISDTELAQRMGRTALDRMNYGPGIFIQRTAPNQASPFIRGLTGEQTLLMLNGVRYSHAMMRPGPNQYAALIPDMSVAAIDAILGSSSTVNGSDGLTGALDYRLAPAGRGVSSTASPWFETRVDTGNGGTLQFGVDGVTDQWAYSLEFSGTKYHDRVGGKDFEDHIFFREDSDSDRIPNTAYEAAAAGFRLAYFGWQDHLLELQAGHARQMDAPRPGGYAQNSGKKDRLYRFFDPQALSYLQLRDRWEVGSPMIERVQTTFWLHQFAEEQFRSSVRDSGTPDERIRRREYDDTINVIGGDLQLTTLLGAQEQHELTYGGTLIHESTANDYRELRTPAGSTDTALLSPYKPEDWSNKTTVSDDSSYMTLGLFLQDDWQIAKGFSLLIGTRYSRHEWSFGDVDGNADDVTGSLRGLWQLNPSHWLFAGASRGFRAPNLSNLDGLVDRGSSGDAAKGNPNLDPEISFSYEAGWRWQDGRNNMAITAFQTDIDDLIQRDFGGSGEFTNIEGADISGVESAWDIGMDLGAMRRLALVGAISLVDATRDIPVEGGGTIEDNISRANRIYGRLGLKYEQNRNWWGLVQTRWHDDYDDVATHPSNADADDVRLTIAGNPDGSMPGYAILDISCGWRSDDGLRHIGLFVENLADETYREPGSGADGVGRSFGMTAGVRL